MTNPIAALLYPVRSTGTDPGDRRAAIRRRLFWASFCSIYFIFVYGATNRITAAREAAGQYIPSLYFSWEARIPVIPAMIVPYMSIDLFFFGSFFLCADLRELRTHAKRILLAISIAGVFFLLLPLKYAFARPVPDGPFGYVFAFLHAFDYPYNLAPSLHIALRSLIWVIFIAHMRGLTRWSVRIWLLLVGASTILVRQHHLLDLITGQILAMFCFYLLPDPLAESERVLHPNEPVRRNGRVALYYALGLGACLTIGYFLRSWGWLMIWPAFALAMVSLAYLGVGPEVFHKSAGRLPQTTRWLLAPYLAGAYLSHFIQRRGKPAFQELARGVLIGRRLDPEEADDLIVSHKLSACLDLTAEFTEVSALRVLDYKNIPILDLTVPTRSQLTDAAQFIATRAAGGRAYVHCGLGHGRAAYAAAAYLLHAKLADTPAGAIEWVRRARPGVVFRADAAETLADAFAAPADVEC